MGAPSSDTNFWGWQHATLNFARSRAGFLRQFSVFKLDVNEIKDGSNKLGRRAFNALLGVPEFEMLHLVPVEFRLQRPKR